MRHVGLRTAQEARQIRYWEHSSFYFLKSRISTLFFRWYVSAEGQNTLTSIYLLSAMVDDSALLTATYVFEQFAPQRRQTRMRQPSLSGQASQYLCRMSLSTHVVASSAVPFAT